MDVWALAGIETEIDGSFFLLDVDAGCEAVRVEFCMIAAGDL